MTPSFKVNVVLIKLDPGEHYTGATKNTKRKKKKPATGTEGEIHIRQRRVQK